MTCVGGGTGRPTLCPVHQVTDVSDSEGTSILGQRLPN